MGLLYFEYFKRINHKMKKYKVHKSSKGVYLCSGGSFNMGELVALRETTKP